MSTATLERPTKAPRFDTLAGAIHRKCRCVRCRIKAAEAAAAIRAEKANGTWQPYVDAAPVLRHVEQLHAEGMSYAQIGRVAGVPYDMIRRLRGKYRGQPATREMRTDNAARLLAVKKQFTRMPDGARMPNLGAMRRVQALRAIGWPTTALVEKSGLSDFAIGAVSWQTWIEASTHRSIEVLYDLLHDQDPAENGIENWVVRRTRREAARRRWAVPAAWTDIDTDKKPNPHIKSGRFQKPLPRARQDEVIEETEHLASFGLTREQIAQRVGITWNAVEQAHGRAGVDLPYIAPNPRPERTDHA